MSPVGVTMNYSLPVFSTYSLSIRPSELMLSFFISIVLLGCDSRSASTDTFETKDDSQTTTKIVIDEQIEDDIPKDESAATEQEGEALSLLQAAKNDEALQKTNSPMIAEKNDSSALQATLIGDYTGMLPCSSCDSIMLTLNLYSDGSVQKTSIYENSPTVQPPQTTSGIYRQDDNKITIVYENKAIDTYLIDDNHLVMMDDNNNPDANYTLSRK